MAGSDIAAIPRKDIVERVTRALGHPIRVAFLETLAMDGVASANTFSQKSGYGLSDSAYHVRVLLNECQLIELVRTRPARGAIEKFFRIAPVSLESADWDRLPPHLLDWLKGAGLLAFTDASIAALSSGGIASDGNSVFTGRMMTLDGRGLDEVTEALRDALGRVEQAERASRRRLEKGSEADAMSVILGAAAFPASQATSLPS